MYDGYCKKKNCLNKFQRSSLSCKNPGFCCSVDRNLEYFMLLHAIGGFATNILGQGIGPLVEGQKHKKKTLFLNIVN